MMHRHRVTRDLKEGSSVSVSALAFIIRLPIEGSAAQDGIKPQCMSLHSLPPLCRTITGIVGEVCSGATLKRGVWPGRSRSRFQRTRMSLNSKVAVKRPHIVKERIAPGLRSVKAVYQSTNAEAAQIEIAKVYSVEVIS